uniref:Uncharacterized protein n=1 Tax=Lepeophtheirus salmonis TaxID=72036 RepID=A0A0K2UF59_LEPSM
MHREAISKFFFIQ